MRNSNSALRLAFEKAVGMGVQEKKAVNNVVRKERTPSPFTKSILKPVPSNENIAPRRGSALPGQRNSEKHINPTTGKVDVKVRYVTPGKKGKEFLI